MQITCDQQANRDNLALSQMTLKDKDQHFPKDMTNLLPNTLCVPLPAPPYA